MLCSTRSSIAIQEFELSLLLYSSLPCAYRPSPTDNEELQDLLAPNTTTKLKLCEDLKKGVVCQNLEEIAVLNVGDIFEIIQRGILQVSALYGVMNCVVVVFAGLVTVMGERLLGGVWLVNELIPSLNPATSPPLQHPHLPC